MSQRLAAQRLYVRADARAETGLGHFMRCLALGQAWLDEGGAVTFIGCHDEALRRRLQEEGMEQVAVGAPHPAVEDLELTLETTPRGAAVVLDGYHFDGAYQRELAAHSKLLVIDDTGHLPAYWGSLLLNQNPDAGGVSYGQAPQRRLLGPRYALLRREFVTAPPTRETTDGARRVLLTFGGADELNCSGAIATALLEASLGVDLRILVGPVNPHESSLGQLGDRHDSLELRIAPRNVAGELVWADLVISAAGSTALELAALGVPALLVAVAANQEPLGRALATAGAAVYLGAWSGLTSPQVAARGLDMLSDRSRLRGLREMGPRMIDGQGARRVCAALAVAT